MLTVKALSPDKTVMGMADGVYRPAGNSPLCAIGEREIGEFKHLLWYGACHRAVMQDGDRRLL